ncbi:unnamed protein product [Tilletia controversa]|nr:unnamed protein product [Tilletia controversa]
MSGARSRYPKDSEHPSGSRKHQEPDESEAVPATLDETTGQVTEFQAPPVLFDCLNSIFRSMRNAAKITREDILTIQAAAERKGSIVEALVQTSAEKKGGIDPES